MYLNSRVLRKIKHILGAAHVKTDALSLALSSYDCSPSSHRPEALLQLTRAEQLAPLLQLLNREKIPFIIRAAGTNHAGSCAAVQGGVVLHLTYLRHLGPIDTELGFAEAEPGVITGHLQAALKPLGFFYGPDPASEAICTLGGNLAQNASGARCLKYGNTADNTLQVSFLTPDGKRFCLQREDPGPDWIGLLAGSEGTLGLIEKMRVKIFPLPSRVDTFLAAFDTLADSIETVSDLIAHGIVPRCVEAMDQCTIQTIESFKPSGFPDAAALLLLELDGTAAQIKQDAALLKRICRQHRAHTFLQAQDETQRQQWWQGRRAAYAAMSALGPTVAVADGTVPRSELPATLACVRDIIEQYGVTASLLFHAGDGNFHPQLVYDARSPQQTRQVHKALQAILKTCVDHGGTLSGEHGIGVEKRALMSYQYTRQTLRLFQKIKRAFDPYSLANPAKIIPINFEEEAADHVEKNPAVLALQAEIKNRFTHKQKTCLVSGTARHATHLSTRTLDKIIEIDKTNYTATVQAGVPLRTLLKALRKEQVYADLPTDYEGTIGGLVATKAAAAFTTQLTGLQAILPDGDIISYGGKLMKNAAGYNVCRLFTGSWGALGLITQITFRIYATPRPACQAVWQPPQENELWQAVRQQLDPHALFITAAEQEPK